MTDAARADRELLARPLTLPCGATLPNRLAKTALAEQLGTLDGQPTSALSTLYLRWAAGGAGLLVTGNVMIDRTARGEPRDVVIEDGRDLAVLAHWARAGRAGGGQVWMQLNHPGRQSPRYLSPVPVAPSAVPMAVNGAVFATPRALDGAEIEALIDRFAKAAAIAKEAGFTGVQLHGAHGYLISQFLSPLTNRRDDAWGGTPEKRRRFVLAVVAAVRAAVGPGFPVGIKLNSADFQRGGFEAAESLAVLQALEAAGIDLLEISGGTYESPAMMGLTASSLAREAYFLAYAEEARATLKTPLMLTGGFRTLRGMAEALASGAVDVIGLGRPLAVEPDLPGRLLAGEAEASRVQPVRLGVKALDGYIEIAWHMQQLQRMAEGLDPDPDRSAWLAAGVALVDNGFEFLRPKRG